eukprot:UN12207
MTYSHKYRDLSVQFQANITTVSRRGTYTQKMERYLISTFLHIFSRIYWNKHFIVRFQKYDVQKRTVLHQIETENFHLWGKFQCRDVLLY